MALQRLVFDFYVAVGLRHRAVREEDVPFVLPPDDLSCLFLTTDTNLALTIQERRKAIIADLWSILLRDVPFILSAEIRHIYDNCCLSPTQKDFFLKNLGEPGLLWFTVYDALYHGKTAIPGVEKFKATLPFTDPHQNSGYLKSYEAAMTATTYTGLPLSVVSAVIFNTKLGASWSGAYGGEAWRQIAVAFGELVAARDVEEAAVVIDKMLALEHNTSTMFNKCSHWADTPSGHGWIKEALDQKFSATSPMALIGNCSPDLQNLVLAVRDTFSHIDPNKRKAYRLDYVDEEGEGLSEEAQGMVEALKVGDGVCLKHKGMDRWFTIKAIQHHAAATLYILKAKDWNEQAGIKNGKPLFISNFTYTKEDVLASVVGVSEAGKEVQMQATLNSFVQTLYADVSKAVGGLADNPGIEVGSLLSSESIHRFRLKKGDKNFRLFVVQAKTEYRVYYSTSPVSDVSLAELPFLITAVSKWPKQMPTLVESILEVALNALA